MVDHLASRPILTDEAVEYYAAWRRLGRDRPFKIVGGGFGPSAEFPLPIPTPAIEARGRHLGFDGFELDLFTDVLTAVDDHYVELQAKQIDERIRAEVARAKTEARRR